MAAANRFSNATMASKLDLPKSDSLTILSLGEGHSKTFQGTHFKNTLHWPSQRASWVSVYPSTPLNWRPFGDVYPLTLLTRGHPLESNGVGSNPATWSQFQNFRVRLSSASGILRVLGKLAVIDLNGKNLVHFSELQESECHSPSALGPAKAGDDAKIVERTILSNVEAWRMTKPPELKQSLTLAVLSSASWAYLRHCHSLFNNMDETHLASHKKSPMNFFPSSTLANSWEPLE